MKLKMIFLIFSLTALLNLSCNTTEPPINNKTISLTVEDVSCTEAWIKVSSNNCDEIIITKDDNPVAQISNLCSKDTIIVIDSLLPNQSYTFQAVVSHGGNITAGSEKVTAVTMDTTSHNFTWETFTFGGEAGSSILNDVAIIDENNIWAVGQIYLKDSLGNDDPQAYNLAKWNGIEWQLIKVPFLFNGQNFYAPIYSIFAFSESDIWLEAGIHWNGNQFQTIPLNIDFPSHVNKIWGTSSRDLYIVGNNGRIAHYNGQSWRKINSGTDLPLNDIWGNSILTDKHTIMALASNRFYNEGKVVLEINSTVARAEDAGLPWSISSLWFRNHKYYIAGDGIFIKN